MKRKITLVAIILVATLLFFAGNALARQHLAQGTAGITAPSIGEGFTQEAVSDLTLRAPRRISIPFGFADNLPLRAGKTITASGHGSCTAGQTVTIAVTVTQAANGATGYGETEETCAGEAILQTWTITVEADQYSTFVDGPATACGLATTRDSEGIVRGDPYDWCKAVRLNWQIYLPALRR